MEGTLNMNDFRLNITVTEYGFDPENGERFLEAFQRTHPEVGPVVSQNLATGELTITFSLQADDANDAFDRGRPIFTEGANATGLSETAVTDVHVEHIDADELEAAEREKVFA